MFFVYFNLISIYQKKTKTIDSILNVLFKQTLKHVEISFRGTARFDISYEKTKELCGEAYKDEDYEYLQIDTPEKKSEAMYYFCNEKKIDFFECIPKTNLF